MASAITESDRRFEIPGTAQVVEGNGGLPKVRITTQEVAGEMYLHGAHVTSWKPAGGQEVLFLSSHNRDGRRGALFVGAYPSVSPGSETRRTIPERQLTGLSARRRGSLSRSSRPVKR